MSVNSFWDGKSIGNLLDKGYNPVALAGTFQSASQFTDHRKPIFDKTNFKTFVELGPLAWTNVTNAFPICGFSKYRCLKKRRMSSTREREAFPKILF